VLQKDTQQVHSKQQAEIVYTICNGGQQFVLEGTAMVLLFSLHSLCSGKISNIER